MRLSHLEQELDAVCRSPWPQGIHSAGRQPSDHAHKILAEMKVARAISKPSENYSGSDRSLILFRESSFKNQPTLQRDGLKAEQTRGNSPFDHACNESRPAETPRHQLNHRSR